MSGPVEVELSDGVYRSRGDTILGGKGSDTVDYASRWNLPPLFVHFVSRPETDLEKRPVFVE